MRSASWRWQHAITRSWIWRWIVWETVSSKQSRPWRAGRRPIDRGSNVWKNRYFNFECEDRFIYLWFASFYLPNICLIFIVADSERAAGSGDKKTTGLFQSHATTWCVGREPAVTYVAPLASSFMAPLAASQHLYVTSCIHCESTHNTNTLLRRLLPPMHMCTADYINLQENSTTTNNECFVYEWTGCAKLF